MDRELLGNSLRAWTYAAGVPLALWLLLSLFRGAVVRRLEGVERRTPIGANGALVALLKSVRTTYIALAALFIGLQTLHLPSGVHTALQWSTAIVLVLQGFRSGNGLVDFWLGHYATSRGGTDRTTVAALGVVLRVVLVVTLLLVALDLLGKDIKSLLTAFGVGGIALALALQNVLGDLFSALSIVLDKPFVVGDAIAVDRFEGTVEHIGLKTTRVRSVNGEEVVFSNADLLKSRVRNLSRRHSRRTVFTLSVAPATRAENVARVPALIAEAVAAEPRATLQRAHVVGSGLLGFDVETAILIADPDSQLEFDVRQAVLLEIYRRLEREGILLARATSVATPSAPPVA